ncbi:hypothetical protein GC176_24160 [bacterium]|nr:hypothetical protein [bacterium]
MKSVSRKQSAGVAYGLLAMTILWTAGCEQTPQNDAESSGQEVTTEARDSDSPKPDTAAVIAEESERADAEVTESMTVARAVESEHLPNAYWLHEKVISGGQPEGADGFRELQELGVRTVISVDGLKPDVDTAKKFGLRYVHLPHGYDGVPEERARELAKAVRSLPGPIYIHCHHGKHRSPAAATVACIGAGLIPRNAGPAILKVAGTSADYNGLFASVDSAKRLDAALLDELKVEFREVVEPPPIVEVMTQLSTTFEHLQLIEATGWATPPDHPALVPTHEALLLKEHFTEFRRGPLVKDQPDEYRHLIDNSVGHAEQLEMLLKTNTSAQSATNSEAQASRALKAIKSDCKACHRAFRDQRLLQRLGPDGSQPKSSAN